MKANNNQEVFNTAFIHLPTEHLHLKASASLSVMIKTKLPIITSDNNNNLMLFQTLTNWFNYATYLMRLSFLV